jgi:hypothetical protein
MRAELGFDIGDDDFGMMRERLCRAQALFKGSHALYGLQRILRTNQPPNLIEPQTLHRINAHRAMSRMRRIERPAKQADATFGESGAGARVGHKTKIIIACGNRLIALAATFFYAGAIMKISQSYESQSETISRVRTERGMCEEKFS